jgi:GNAT superfamily N-acetyltransferase
MNHNATLIISEAIPADLPGMIQVLSEDTLGGHDDLWDETRADAYHAAFAHISSNPDMVLLVAKQGDQTLGLLHLIYLRGLPDGGALRAMLNSVFVGAAARGHGVGAKLVLEAENRARLRGARFMTLTSNKKRVDAHRFYRNLGYAQAHEGFKKEL